MRKMRGTPLRVDASGQPVVAGSTFSSDFPVTGRAFQRQLRGKQDDFVRG